MTEHGIGGCLMAAASTVLEALYDEAQQRRRKLPQGHAGEDVSVWHSSPDVSLRPPSIPRMDMFRSLGLLEKCRS